MVCYSDTGRKRGSRWGFLHRRETVHAVMTPRIDEIVIGGPSPDGRALTNLSGDSTGVGVLAPREREVGNGPVGKQTDFVEDSIGSVAGPGTVET